MTTLNMLWWRFMHVLNAWPDSSSIVQSVSACKLPFVLQCVHKGASQNICRSLPACMLRNCKSASFCWSRNSTSAVIGKTEYTRIPSSRKPILSNSSPMPKIMSPLEQRASDKASTLNLRTSCGLAKDSSSKSGCLAMVPTCKLICTSSRRCSESKLSSSTSPRFIVSLCPPEAALTYLSTRSLSKASKLCCRRKAFSRKSCLCWEAFMPTKRLMSDVVLDTKTEKTTMAKKSTMTAKRNSSSVVG
mmetsp:Transcript_54480/g.129865  ORF Transcript_54480/g.129865 Transcript_54480/m.129865 type:complete len:246 (-) Transcript_54480:1548-2285(-)